MEEIPHVLGRALIRRRGLEGKSEAQEGRKREGWPASGKSGCRQGVVALLGGGHCFGHTGAFLAAVRVHMASTRTEIVSLGRTYWTAARSLVDAGGTDFAASLAYYTLLSFVPFASLVLLISTSFVGLESLQRHWSMVIGIYFPVSQEFLDAAITPLVNARPVVGAVSVVGMIWGANGLFRATNRTVNRVFGSQQRQLLGMALAELAFAGGIIALFLFTIVISGLLRVATDVTGEYAASSRLLSEISSLGLKFLFGVVSPVVTFLVFLMVYRSVPNCVVQWRDAAFGAISAVVLFEVAKYTFFWVGSHLGNQSLIYGPLSSVVILLIWSQFAALIFLFGVSLTRERSSHVT